MKPDKFEDILEDLASFVCELLFWILVLLLGLFIGKTTFVDGVMTMQSPFMTFGYFVICFIYLYFKK